MLSGAIGEPTWSSVRSTLIDVIVGAALAAGLWMPLVPETPALRVVQLSLAITVALGFVLRRWFPRSATTIVALATAAGWWFAVTGDPFLIAGICLFAAAERFGTRRFPWWLLTAGALLLASILFVAADGEEARLLGALVGSVVLGTAWVLGVRTRQAREETARRVRAEERLRLARDVHDVLSHTLGAIGVRAGVLAHVESSSRERLRDALREIEEDSRAALGDLRSLLDRERTDADQPASGASLAALVTDALRPARNIGVRVDADVALETESAPANVRTTAFRIVQESATNVVRHARASSCTVTVRVDAGNLVVEVRDDGQGAGGRGRNGHGLAGMRERVLLLGGTVQAGNAAEGGFRVRAELPLDPPAKGAS